MTAEDRLQALGRHILESTPGYGVVLWAYTEIVRLRKEVEELKEYRWMYEDLRK